METGIEVITYWLKLGNQYARLAGLRIARQLLRAGYPLLTVRRDIMEGVAIVLAENIKVLEKLGLDAYEYKRTAIQVVHELCIYRDSMRVAAASAGVVIAILQQLSTDPPSRMQHSVLRALHNLCHHSLPKAQLATSGGIPTLVGHFGNGMREAKWVPRQKYEDSVVVDPHLLLREGKMSAASHSRDHKMDTAFKIRSLEYCSAIIRLFADAQSPEWADDLLRAGIVPMMIEALSQSTSYIVKKQALGTLTSLASIRDSGAPAVVAMEGGSISLFSLRSDALQNGLQDADQWLAWTCLALYHLLENKETKNYVVAAAKDFLDDPVREYTASSVKRVLRPNVDNVNVEWIAAV